MRSKLFSQHRPVTLEAVRPKQHVAQNTVTAGAGDKGVQERTATNTPGMRVHSCCKPPSSSPAGRQESPDQRTSKMCSQAAAIAAWHRERISCSYSTATSHLREDKACDRFNDILGKRHLGTSPGNSLLVKALVEKRHYSRAYL